MQSPDESGRGLHLVQDTDESYPLLTTCLLYTSDAADE